MRLPSLVIAAAVSTASLASQSSLLVQAQTNTTIFKYRTYSQIVDSILALEAKYPQFVEVFTAQDRYGIPNRQELLCTRNGEPEPCLHYVAKITDEASLPDPARPEVFFSGALHGNERVGPQVVMALAQLLVDHASRPDGNPWIKRLVRTRTIVIMPTTNAEGYDKNKRTEGKTDPNRDFPYSKGSTCFETIVARAVNEVWRDHLFQLAITFHGGGQSITYEWGSTNHAIPPIGSQKSPDDLAQVQVTTGLSRFGGKFADFTNDYYPTGTMNEVVFPVDGGMEDWGYAASWENQFTTPKPIGVCNPTTYGGYPAEKSIYNNATHRAFNILVEMSFDHTPLESTLGDSVPLSDEVLADFWPATRNLGHVPRNVRLALMYIDVVQPYVQWKSAPTTGVANSAVKFNWEVLGAFTVDSTQLKISKTPDFATVEKTVEQKGVTRWYHPDMKTSTATNKGLFSHDVTFLSPGVYYVQAVATVDQDWQKQGVGKDLPSPNVKPQTHVVNGRTNLNWFYSNNGKIVKGQLEWTSPVVKVVVA